MRQCRRHDADGRPRQQPSESDHAASRAQWLALGDRLSGDHRPQPRESERQARRWCRYDSDSLARYALAAGAAAVHAAGTAAAQAAAAATAAVAAG